MTEDEAEKFFKQMKSYAVSRSRDADWVEEFPAYAYEMLEVRKWKTPLKQVWNNFIRSKIGAKGSAKNEVETAIKFRPVYYGASVLSSLCYVEHAVAAPEKAEFNIDGASLQTRMIVCLLRCGFEWEEIRKVLRITPSFLEKLKKQVRLEVRDSILA